MKEKKINPSLQMRIRRFIEFDHAEQKYKSNLENLVFDSLPMDLKQNLYLEANFKIIKKIKIFEKFTESFLKKLTPKFTEFNIPHEEILYQVFLIIFLFI